jgi:uncharacterized protein YqgV (UPF0045/DUF77 family)
MTLMEFSIVSEVSSRISLNVKFDHHKGVANALEGKIKRVIDKSGRHLKT